MLILEQSARGKERDRGRVDGRERGSSTTGVLTGSQMVLKPRVRMVLRKPIPGLFHRFQVKTDQKFIS